MSKLFNRELLWKWTALSLGFVVSSGSVPAHEPIFGIGPHTVYKDGIGLELEYEREQEEHGTEQALHFEAAYGLTEDWAVVMTVPQEQKVEEIRTASGIGDATLKTKYRFYRKDYPEGRQDQLALMGAIKFPTGDYEAEPALGSGSKDYLLGLTGGRESRTLYFFADLRCRFNGENPKKKKQGNAWLYGASLGFRPWLSEYWEPDLVLLVEIFGKQQTKTILDGQELKNTGGQTIFLGPSFLWSYKNMMVTGGMGVPVRQDLNGNQENKQYRFALGIEQHL